MYMYIAGIGQTVLELLRDAPVDSQVAMEFPKPPSKIYAPFT